MIGRIIIRIVCLVIALTIGFKLSSYKGDTSTAVTKTTLVVMDADGCQHTTEKYEYTKYINDEGDVITSSTRNIYLIIFTLLSVGIVIDLFRLGITIYKE